MKKKFVIFIALAMFCITYVAFATEATCYDGCLAIGDPIGTCANDHMGLECYPTSAFQDCDGLREVPCRDGTGVNQ